MAITKNSQIDLNGNEMILDADGDTTITSDTDDQIDFKTAGTDRVQINSTGDFLVRQTSADVYDTNTGGTVRQYWGNQFSAQNNTNSRVIIGSASNSGLVGGATVNSGGTRPIVNSYISFGSTNQTAGSEAGMVQFYTSTGGATGAVRARIDSDGLKFGSDTAAANALDDYEQGTWTPTLPNGGTINTNYASRYTKIGNVVYWYSYLLLSFVNDSNAFRVTLPFNTSSVTSDTYVHGSVGYTGSVVTDDLRSHVQPNSNPAYVYFHETDGAAGIVANSNLYARNSGDGRLTAWLFSGWYYTED